VLSELVVPLVMVTLPSNPLPQSDTLVKAAVTPAALAADAVSSATTTATTAAIAREMRFIRCSDQWAVRDQIFS
jgi:hypothetical protein